MLLGHRFAVVQRRPAIARVAETAPPTSDVPVVAMRGTSSGACVYVANGHGHSITIIDAKAWKIAAIVPVGRRPWGVAVSPDGRKVYTANGLSNDVSVADTATRSVVKVIPAGDGPWDVAVAH